MEKKSAEKETSIPARSFMEDPKIRWRHGEAPNYDKANQHYMAGRTKNHQDGSLEKIVENLVKTFEMEAVHKTYAEDWCSVDHDNFCIVANGNPPFYIDDVIKHGTYNVLLSNNTMYDKPEIVESNEHFKTAFPDGFSYEVLKVTSGPPRVSFTWRHWAKWTGPYRGIEPTNELIELYGSCVANVTQDLKLQEVEFYFDGGQFLSKLMKTHKCPVLHPTPRAN